MHPKDSIHKQVWDMGGNSAIKASSENIKRKTKLDPYERLYFFPRLLACTGTRQPSPTPSVFLGSPWYNK